MKAKDILDRELLKQAENARSLIKAFHEQQDFAMSEVRRAASVLPTLNDDLLKQASALARLQVDISNSSLQRLLLDTKANASLFADALKPFRILMDDVTAAKAASTQLVSLMASANAAMNAFNDARHMHSVLSDVWRYIPEQAEERSEEQIEDDLRAFKDFLARLLAQLPPLSADVVVPFVLSLIVAFYLSYRSSLDLARVETKVDLIGTTQRGQTEAIEELKEYVKKLVPQQSAQSLPKFVATMNTRARRTLTTCSEIVGVIYKGQTVELLEDRGKRLKVRYIDFHAAVQKEGWVLKKYMKRLQMK